MVAFACIFMYALLKCATSLIERKRKIKLPHNFQNVTDLDSTVLSVGYYIIASIFVFIVAKATRYKLNEQAFDN